MFVLFKNIYIKKNKNKENMCQDYHDKRLKKLLKKRFFLSKKNVKELIFYRNVLRENIYYVLWTDRLELSIFERNEIVDRYEKIIDLINIKIS